MADMLVNLYSLPEASFDKTQSYQIRTVLPPEKHKVVDWVREHFSENWVSECEVACTKVPANCLIAVQDNEILGFACYDTTFPNFFGPTGVKEGARGQGIGYQLLLASLFQLRAKGYAYAIIGDAGPVDFYKKTIGAVPIDGVPVLKQLKSL
ncbi:MULTISPECIES: GNAT family N-acetyltransferase [Gracilibacillus]|uniref:GNAT family N-acetyltransferase n=1 Tax=Gracilibacillus thailandensis TaxID=563735 RepID=A0A6N7R1N6_9BACI|nr:MULTISPECIES: GNAT family N-acetyltransferase [Gracilibacillus]MRI67201.1 GNAT family N-acetyltransferase [Gracilibacillus thailandensis]